MGRQYMGTLLFSEFFFKFKTILKEKDYLKNEKVYFLKLWIIITAWEQGHLILIFVYIKTKHSINVVWDCFT